MSFNCMSEENAQYLCHKNHYMEIQHYCYTRTKYLDYGDFVIPSNLSGKELDVVCRKVLSITADNHLQLTVPKWLLIKTGNKIIWGCCCSNYLLANDKGNSKDYSGTPVYGFFSIVISDYSSDLKIPYDVRYFCELYSMEVESFWNRREEHACSTNGYISGNFKYIEANRNTYAELLNTDIFHCQSLGELDKEGVIAAALTLDNVSLLIDNDNIEQATNRKGAFMNCLTSSVGFGLYAVRQQCPKCGKYVSSFTSTGVCMECEDADIVKNNRLRKEKEDMDRQIMSELEEARNRIAELETEVEVKHNCLKKKDSLVKILICAICVLLLALLYSISEKEDFQWKLFRGEQKPESGFYDTTHSLQSFSFDRLKIQIDPKGENVPIYCKTQNLDITDIEFSFNVDWIRIVGIKPDTVTINVMPYGVEARREATLTAKYGEQTQSVTIIQGKI